MEQELARSDLKQAGNSTDADDLARQKAQEENAHQLIERMRNLKATGRIVLGLDQNQNDLAKLMELPLEDGDMFIAPPRPATINVIGAVYNPNSFLYDARLRVADYLREAGGSSRTADKDRIFIVRADGAVIPKQGSGRIGIHFDDLHMNAGDSLVVPDAFPKMPLLRGLRDWTQVFSQLVLGAAAINILR
jgi:protein involved in polysaccharide export with SLBB domain